MYELYLLTLIISFSITAVSVARWRDAEKKIKVLQGNINPNSVFEIVKEFTPDADLKKCTVVLYTRKGIPAISDMTGRPMEQLAQEFDDAERKGKLPYIFETKEFKA